MPQLLLAAPVGKGRHPDLVKRPADRHALLAQPRYHGQPAELQTERRQ